MSEIEPVQPVVTVEEIVSRPDYAAGKLEASTEQAEQWMPSAGTMVAGGILMALLGGKGLSMLIRRAAGPYGGLIDLVGSIFAPPKPPPEKNSNQQ